MKPLVTVVTPTVGRLNALEAALASVSQQDTPAEQVVVGDDCYAREVRDQVAEVVSAFPHASFIDVTAQDLPAGLQPYLPARIAYLRNHGAAHGTGAYVSHLDDDNTFEPEHLSSLVRTLDEAPHTPVAHSWRALVHADGSAFIPDGVDPWVPDPKERRESYAHLASLGVFEAGSSIVKDTMWDGDRLIARIDTGEFLIRADFAREHPFPQRFTRGQQLLEITEDMAYTMMLGRLGVRPVCSARPTLRYSMGGYSNADSMDPSRDRVTLMRTEQRGGNR